MNRKILLALLVVVAMVAGLYLLERTRKPSTDNQTNNVASNLQTNSSLPPENSNANQNTNQAAQTPGIVSPISQASERITKKFFGTYVTPQNSPVQPERFTGYHTGLDFETFPEEQTSDVVINVICTGPLLQKRTASGYGGVAVQKCTINNQTVTVVYGHMRLSSISATVGANLDAGDKLGVLGTGFSSETDGERKHLHLGIHKGATVTLTGYVSSKGALSAWLDPKTVLGL